MGEHEHDENPERAGESGFDQHDENPERAGESGFDQRTAPAGQGHAAPPVNDSGEFPEMSIFDAQGNESIVVFAPNEDGVPAEGTGPDRESALKDAQKGDSVLGDAF